MHTNACETEHIPDGFLQRDIRNDSETRRHIVFASVQQLQLICNAKVWYADATFQLVKQSFTQLSLHIFLKHGDCTKQVPLLFVLMSGRKTYNYKDVLRAVTVLPPSEPRVKRVVIDFERTIWKGCASVMRPPPVAGGTEEGAGIRPTEVVYERNSNTYVHQVIDRTALPPCSTHTGGIPQPGAGCRKRVALSPRRWLETAI